MRFIVDYYCVTIITTTITTTFSTHLDIFSLLQQQQQPSTNGGGSLERRTARIKANGIDPTAYSDSEYGKYGSGQVRMSND
jgi:hypothetical protein